MHRAVGGLDSAIGSAFSAVSRIPALPSIVASSVSHLPSTIASSATKSAIVLRELGRTGPPLPTWDTIRLSMGASDIVTDGNAGGAVGGIILVKGNASVYGPVVRRDAKAKAAAAKAKVVAKAKALAAKAAAKAKAAAAKAKAKAAASKAKAKAAASKAKAAAPNNAHVVVAKAHAGLGT